MVSGYSGLRTCLFVLATYPDITELESIKMVLDQGIALSDLIAGLKQKICIRRTDHNVVGRGGLMCLRRWPDLRHRAGELAVRISLDGERHFITELDLAAVLRADNGVDVSEGGIHGDDEKRRRF